MIIFSNIVVILTFVLLNQSIDSIAEQIGFLEAEIYSIKCFILEKKNIDPSKENIHLYLSHCTENELALITSLVNRVNTLETKINQQKTLNHGKSWYLLVHFD